eukprot:ANDGO_00470.mRNA.1 4-aminobutyrate transaminase
MTEHTARDLSVLVKHSSRLRCIVDAENKPAISISLSQFPVSLLRLDCFTHLLEQSVFPVYAYAIGGYGEHRPGIYATPLFTNNTQEPRDFHLGIDVFCASGSKVYAPLDGVVHSFANNANAGDYGPTIVLSHSVGRTTFYTLYGHLSLDSLEDKFVGKVVQCGEQIASVGDAGVNGGWSPHVHFQAMWDMQHWVGDYPGTCKYSERCEWLQRCPDPMCFLADLTIQSENDARPFWQRCFGHS